MSLQKRALAAGSGVLMAFLVALGGIPAAQASDGAQDGTRVTSVSDDGQEPRTALTARSAAADTGGLANPGVSPAPENTFSNKTFTEASNLVKTCPSGRFCTYQRQDDGQYRAYDFFTCADYQLSNWFDVRRSYNNQTDGVAVSLRGSGGQEVDKVTAGQTKFVDWDPVWTIRLCD